MRRPDTARRQRAFAKLRDLERRLAPRDDRPDRAFACLALASLPFGAETQARWLAMADDPPSWSEIVDRHLGGIGPTEIVAEPEDEGDQ